MRNFLIILFLLMAGCSTMQPPRYSISVDNIQKLRDYSPSKVEIVSLTQTDVFHASCRLMGPIEPADGMTIAQFVAKAFNDELKMAGIYSDKGVKISGNITKIKFSSVSGITGGYWDIGISLQSTSGKSLMVENKYSFQSGFDAITACNATADALSSAVQDLIGVVVNHPDFGGLLVEKKRVGFFE